MRSQTCTNTFSVQDRRTPMDKTVFFFSSLTSRFCRVQTHTFACGPTMGAQAGTRETRNSSTHKLVRKWEMFVDTQHSRCCSYRTAVRYCCALLIVSQSASVFSLYISFRKCSHVYHIILRCLSGGVVCWPLSVFVVSKQRAPTSRHLP